MQELNGRAKELQSKEDEAKKRQQYYEKLKDAYELIFSSEQGKLVLEDIKASGCLYRSIFNSDALLMARDAGKQDMAEHIVFMAKPRDKKETKPKKAVL